MLLGRYLSLYHLRILHSHPCSRGLAPMRALKRRRCSRITSGMQRMAAPPVSRRHPLRAYAGPVHRLPNHISPTLCGSLRLYSEVDTHLHAILSKNLHRTHHMDVRINTTRMDVGSGTPCPSAKLALNLFFATLCQIGVLSRQDVLPWGRETHDPSVAVRQIRASARPCASHVDDRAGPVQHLSDREFTVLRTRPSPRWLQRCGAPGLGRARGGIAEWPRTEGRVRGARGRRDSDGLARTGTQGILRRWMGVSWRVSDRRPGHWHWI
ncbi:hypothetical protein BC628DRAFT_1047933 [Trametes gibbosa]|nr:hypothetical protein BC628DRAFT_1047933 [Trametes gibbosa]